MAISELWTNALVPPRNAPMWFHVWMGSSEDERDWFDETDLLALALSSAKHIFCSFRTRREIRMLHGRKPDWSPHLTSVTPFFASQVLHADRHPLLYVALETPGLA